MRRLWRAGGTAIALACIAASAAQAAPLGPVPGLPAEALTVMNAPAYRYGEWYIAVRDAATGAPLVELNADRLAQPGSVVKTYSMGAGWLQFGPGSRVTTPVKRTGRLAGGRLRGNLILVGKGDITMDGRTKPDGTVDFANLDHNDANEIPGATLTAGNPLRGLDRLARQVRSAGIRRVAGDVIVDDRLWETSQLVNGPVTPIVINENLIDFVVRPGRPGRPATVPTMRPKVAPWRVVAQVRTVAAGGRTNVVVSSPRHGLVVLSGTIAADSRAIVRTYAFADPARFARTAFIEALRRAGVAVGADPVAANPERLLPSRAATERLRTVARLRSLPLREEATYVLKVSYNRGGQTMICRLAVAAGGTGCDDDGLAKAQAVWAKAGLDTTGAALTDGSGLSGNLITVDNQAQLQQIMARRPDAAAWQATLPILGVDGSLATVQANSPAAGRVFAKTGTLGGWDPFNRRLILPTKALGGIMEARSGRRLTFAIVVTNGSFSDIAGVFAANDDVGKVTALIQQAY